MVIWFTVDSIICQPSENQELGAIMHLLIKLHILLHLSPGIYGAIKLTCGPIIPSTPQSMTCSCENTVSNGVEWWEDTTLLSNCIFSANCSSYPSGYTFALSQSEKTFNMTVNPYNYTDCKQFTCKDFSNTSIEQSKKPSTIEFDSTMPSAIAEPVLNHTSGDITITTSCISGYSDLIANWYIFSDGMKKSYIPEPDVVIKRTDTSTCIKCNNEPAARITIGFRHEEAVDKNAQEGVFGLELHHPNFPLDTLALNTSNIYKVKGDSSCEILCHIVCILLIVCIVCIVIVLIVGGILLSVILKQTEKEDITDDNWSTSSLEIGLNILSIILWVIIIPIFIWSLDHCCSCENTCDCCAGVPLGVFFGILFLIHLVLWIIHLILYVLFIGNRKGPFKTVRMIFSTIPLVGLFPSLGWLIRIWFCFCFTTGSTFDIPSFKLNQNLDPRKKETGKENSGETLHYQHRPREEVDWTSDSGVNIIYIGTQETEVYSGSLASGESSTQRNVVMKADSKYQRNEQKTKNGSKKKTSSENDDDSPSYFPAKLGNAVRRRKESRKRSNVKKLNPKPASASSHTGNEQKTKTGSEKETSSEDTDDSPSYFPTELGNTVPRRTESRKKTNGNKLNNKSASASPHTGNEHITKTGSEMKTSSEDDDDSPSYFPAKLGNAGPRETGSRTKSNRKKLNTKSASAGSHTGSDTLTANFDDVQDDTTGVR